MNVLSFRPKTRFGCEMYAVSDGAVSVIIDPSVFPGELPEDAVDLSTVRGILLTHAHFDHMTAMSNWHKETGAAVYIPAEDVPKLSDPMGNASFLTGTPEIYTVPFCPVSDGDVLSFGTFRIKVVGTPGHTSGSVTYRPAEDMLFVGDLLFADGSHGRTDLPTGNEDKIEESIKKIMAEKDDVRIFPGHGRPTSVGRLRNYQVKFI